ncbi:MAG TPA: RNA-guided endonuclease TnpB family protein [Bacteroidales bacterium]|nr:RNA-guided endonuclease TnpB family protein [Bacteroidales bacterium]
MKQDYTYKLRLTPTKEQEVLLSKHFGSIRWTYNFFLDRRTRFYLEAKEKQLAKKTLTYVDMAKELTKIKEQPETEWLNECNAQSLQHAIKHLDGAYNRFFKKLAKFPRFKSKKNKQSFRVPQFVTIKDGRIYFPKFKEGIKIDQHRPVEGEINYATIIKNKAGQYYACIGVSRNIEKKSKLDKIIGIDLGVKTLVQCSDGQRFDNIKATKKYEKLLKTRQQALSRTKKDSKGRDKARLRVGKLQVKIANIRHNHLHQITSKLINENQVICLEDLSVKNMMANHCLSKSIGDVSWGELVRQLTYKADWYGRKLVKIDRFFPSSKTCSHCGYVNDNLTLNMREWDCPRCQRRLDRDFNASQNILRQGLNLTVGTTELAVCPDVRPIKNNGRLVGTETTTSLA